MHNTVGCLFTYISELCSILTQHGHTVGTHGRSGALTGALTVVLAFDPVTSGQVWSPSGVLGYP